MAAELVWRSLAEDQLQSTVDYIDDRNPRAAVIYADDILAACERLRDFPLLGRAFGGLYRLIVVRNHLVVYCYDEQASKVTIIAVIDGRRDVSALMNTLEADGSTY